MVATPEGLSPGPDGTFYGPLGDFPNAWQFRFYTEGKWEDDRLGVDPTSVVQARPAPLGPPMGIRFDNAIVTVWGEMRDRPDLDQWEYAILGALGSSWTRCNHIAADTPDDFPLIVRRRGGVR